MQKDDRIAAAVILVVLGGLFVLLCLALRFAFGLFGAAEGLLAAGIAPQTAFLWAAGSSAALVALFALVAGDGALGELPAVIVGFFVLTAFFFVALVWVF